MQANHPTAQDTLIKNPLNPAGVAASEHRDMRQGTLATCKPLARSSGQALELLVCLQPCRLCGLQFGC